MLVHVVEQDPDGLRWNRVYDGEGDTAVPVKETVYVRFTNLSLADVESKWGDFDGWQKALEDRPYNTLLDTFGFIWEVPRAKAGKMMLDDDTDDYSTAVGAAFMMSQGISGDAVVRVIARGVSSAKDLRERLAVEGLKAVEEAEREEDEALAASRADDVPAIPTPPSPSLPTSSGSRDGYDWGEGSTSSGG